ncbi:MAG: CusA/CzcA family heavy metal efflux RND transporter [Polyangiales bacterium]
MIDALVRNALARRWLVLAVFILVAAFGYASWKELAVEAYPDIADTTAQVITQFSGHAAEEVEEQVTVPIERELQGTPGLSVMRSRSTFGLSLITLVFEDGVDDYFARQRVRERLAAVSLPPGAEPDLDPLTSPIGEIFRYTLQSPVRDQRELRELQRWVVAPALKTIPGVADVTSFGGETTQFQLLLDPNRLAQYHVSLRVVVDAVERNNTNAGGSIMVRGDQGFVIRGIGLIRNLDDLGRIVVTEDHGTPVYLRNLGALQLGALARNGILGIDDNPDGVSGIVLLLRGQNPSRVLSALHARVAGLNRGGLPPDVRVVPYLDRTDLVDTTLRTVSHTMLEGIGLVCLVLLLFLGSPRAALIVATAIPLSILIAFILMRFTGIPANLLSLGAIDFGVIVDGAIVLMEVVLRSREEHPDRPLTESDARAAALSVARPMFFATAIIITAYLPLFAFQRVEKKLFSPMAYTVGYALFGAVMVALTLVPGMALAAFAKPVKLPHNPALAMAERAYRAVLENVLRRPLRVLVPAALGAALAVILAGSVGKEFLPELDEGSLWLQVQLPPGISLARGATMANELRAALRESPEITHVVTQLGRNDDGTDPWTPSHIECSVGLRPYATWPAGLDKHGLIRRLDARLSRIPGLVYGFSQPMIDGVNDKIAGAHSELVVKVFGDDLDDLRRVGAEVVTALRAVRGSADVAIDQEPPLPQVRIHVDREAAARYGVNMADIADLIEVGIGGRAVAQVFRGERRYDVAVRFIDSARQSPEAIGNLTLTAPSGARVPLSQVARIELRAGESTITREAGRRHLTVKLNLRARDLSSFLVEARARIARDVRFDPQRVSLAWGGQFENQQRAQQRLAVILPAVLALIALLLDAAFGTLRHAGMILMVVPLALLGGMAALHIRGMTLNVSSAVGFIALFGVSVQDAVLMLSALRNAHAAGLSLHDSAARGAQQRLRPVLMTASVATLGMLPAALAHGIGSDVQRPLATVVVGGLAVAPFATLLVLPALYAVFERRAEAAARRGEAAERAVVESAP